MTNAYRVLDKEWSFTQLSSSGSKRVTADGEWLKTEHFPTTVHVELLKKEKIPDPVRGT
jgi:beta-mannosidase